MPDQLTIARLDYETPDALGIGLAVPPSLREKFRFKAGQFILVQGEIKGEKITRSYSITSSPQQYARSHMLYIVVKKLAGGLFSNHLHGTLQLGDKVTVSAPRGLFYWLQAEKTQDKTKAPAKTKTKRKAKAKRKATTRPHYVAFAAGSGITPIMAVLKTILQNEPHARISLFYGNRTAADIIFHDALHELKDMYMERFECFYLLSQQARDIDFLSGRIDKARVQQFAELQLCDPAQTDQFFICGPGEMIKDVEAGLQALNVAADKIRTEKFVAQLIPQKLLPKAAQTRKAKPKRKTGATTGKGKSTTPTTLVDVIFDGTRKQIKLQDKNTNILDAAQEQGLKLPFSCRGGMCSTCRCKLTQGRVTMAANYCLEEWEIKAGFVLACQSRPETAKITLNFDES